MYIARPKAALFLYPLAFNFSEMRRRRETHSHISGAIKRLWEDLKKPENRLKTIVLLFFTGLFPIIILIFFHIPRTLLSLIQELSIAITIWTVLFGIYLKGHRLLAFFSKGESYFIIIAHVMFAGLAVSFIWVFHVPNNGPHYIRHIGVTTTVWASLAGAFDFAMEQARKAYRIFIATNLLILSSTVLLCLIAIATEQSNEAHIVFVHGALLLYIVWDLIAIKYYKPRTRYWYRWYRLLLIPDLLLFGSFFFAYLPLVIHHFPAMANSFEVANASGKIDWSPQGLTDAVIGCLLISELLVYWLCKLLLGRFDYFSEEILSVRDGYRLVADAYDNENAVMVVERRHTNGRLAELDLNGTIVDLGCGTGYYTAKILEHASKIYAIDPSPEMLERFHEKVGRGHKNLQVMPRQFSALRELGAGSVDGILCCLVIDHLDKDELRDALRDISEALRKGGWLYITDVNPYYEKLEHPYASFIDSKGVGRKVQVFPHSIKEIDEHLNFTQLTFHNLNEVLVVADDVTKKPELGELVDFPLVFEYYFVKDA